MPEQLDEETRRLIEGIAARARSLVTEQPEAADELPVVRLASPETIAAELADTVGLGLDAAPAQDAPALDAPAHSAFTHAAPAHPAHPAHSADRLLAAVDKIIGRSVRTDHPLFVNQNFAGADPAAVAGDWLGAALNTSAATYEIAPVFTLLERAVLDKLARLAGFPSSDRTGLPAGVFTAGGSLAMLHALQLARHRASPEVVAKGAAGAPSTVLVGSSGHYATSKAAALLGIGRDRVVPVPCDAEGAMRPDALAGLLAELDDVVAVVATAGTTVTGAFDPLDPIADACAEFGVWLHVDGAYGASALFSPRQRHRLAGAERADSLNWNLHKMMGMTQQCSTLLVREPWRLADAFAHSADYLFQPDKLHGELDSGDSGFMCGRRADVLKLWVTWKARGDAGFAERIDRAVATADHVRRRIRRSGGRFAAVVEGSFANVCLVWVPPELRPLRLASAAVGPDPVTDPAPSAASGRTGTPTHEASCAASLSNETPRAVSPHREAPCEPPPGTEALDRLNRLAPRIKARMQAQGTALIGFQPVNGVNCFRLIFMNPRTGPAEADIMLDLLERYGAEEWPRLD